MDSDNSLPVATLPVATLPVATLPVATLPVATLFAPLFLKVDKVVAKQLLFLLGVILVHLLNELFAGRPHPLEQRVPLEPVPILPLNRRLECQIRF